jgi:hypothetical protein
MPIGANLPDTYWLGAELCATTLCTLLSAVVLSAWLAVAIRRTSGLTLRAPVGWAAASVATLMIAHARSSGSSPAWAAVAQYLSAVGTFCPSMALLGAKRPQDRAWQFVVATLWLILALPALQSIVVAPGGRLELHPAWRWFLLVLIAISVTNYLPTRFALPAILAGTAQMILLREHLPWTWPWPMSEDVATAIPLALLAAAVTLVGISGWATHRAATATNRVWLDFRNAYGVVWGLRVMERVNQVARQEGCAERLGWQGLPPSCDPLSGSPTDPLQVTFRAALRRFVSPDWIDRRIGVT